jgi:hypothetical protein
MVNIAGYAYDHTTCDILRWYGLEKKERGPYYVSATGSASKDRFLECIRLLTQQDPRCDLMDCREHTLGELTQWIGIRDLAFRIIGLGVLLEVFELSIPWSERHGETRDEMARRLRRGDDCRFKLTASCLPEPRDSAFKEMCGKKEALRRPGSLVGRCPACGVMLPISGMNP